MLSKEKDEIIRLEKNFEQVFIRENKAILYDEKEKENLKDSTDFLKVPNLEDMFPNDVLENIQDFSEPKLEFSNVK